MAAPVRTTTASEPRRSLLGWWGDRSVKATILANGDVRQEFADTTEAYVGTGMDPRRQVPVDEPSRIAAGLTSVVSTCTY
jgi:hypothetical protein